MSSAFVPLVSALLSAFVAATVSLVVVFLGRRTDTIKLQQSLRTTAYVDFIRGVAGLALLQKDTLLDEKHFREGRALETLVADAKARIAIYGGREAVAALAHFLRGGGVLDSPQSTKEFASICQLFRNDGRPKLGSVSEADMHFLLFGTERAQC
jgi:hypothetical protein